MLAEAAAPAATSTTVAGVAVEGLAAFVVIGITSYVGAVAHCLLHVTLNRERQRLAKRGDGGSKTLKRRK